ncbi:serine/threonine protein kinase, negative regulator of sexual conjugation and meiosis [Mycena olivaceomarginata]|nr:serine/threonine protein kinase, negative regulator of sexual conjugation and meiosis [Mycena olivaceomarginata]
MHPSASELLPDLTGQLIDGGNLELLCLLGSGAYGKVYKALDTTSPPHDLAYYAVKCMPKYEAGTRDAEIQENELLIHRMVSDHPRVITFHDHFFTDEFVFVVLELCTGGDFSTPWSTGKNSVYHRDIKPENILCNSAGTELRLADFGLSTQVAVSTQFGCGSRFYMSPESIDRSYACYSTRHSDLWALSVIFTNMISGRHPWYSAEVSDRGFAAFRADNNYLLDAMKITRPANALLKRCFHMNPLRRPTLAEFREAVNAIDSFSLEDKPRLPPALPPRRLPRPLPQFPLTASTTLEWDATPSSAAGDCEKTPKPACTMHMPQPIMFTSFDLDSSLSSFVAGPPSSNSDSSAPSVVSAADSSPPRTPATFPADPADMCVSSIPSLADAVHLPTLPKRAYLGHLRPPCADPVRSMITKPPVEYRTVASNVRPTLPTRKAVFDGAQNY